MGRTTLNTLESPSQSQSASTTIPNLQSVTSVSVNTGSVSYNVSGNNVTVNVWGGASTRSQGYSYYPTMTGTDYRNSSSEYSFAGTILYDDGTYTGNISKSGNAYVVSGALVSADSKTVTDYRTTSSYNYQSTMSYSSGGYSGTLNATGNPYVISGSAGYTDNRSQSGTYSCSAVDHYEWTGSSWNRTGTNFSPDSVSYSSDGWSGTLSLVSYGGPSPSYPARPPAGTPSGTTTTRSASGGSTYSGTVYKTYPDTYTYRQDYSGTVNRPSSDTRMWRQDYSGTVTSRNLSSGTTYYYSYVITIDYIDRQKIGTYKLVKGNSTILSLPIYDPNIGMGGVNQLRIKVGSKTGCFELTATNDPGASPLRVQTPSGTKSIKT